LIKELPHKNNRLLSHVEHRSIMTGSSNTAQKKNKIKNEISTDPPKCKNAKKWIK